MHLKKFYLALDFKDADKIKSWAKFAAEHNLGVKVGLEAFVRFGPTLVETLVKGHLSVFLDLKLFDIPNTVLKTIDVINRLGVDCFTLHAQCGDEVWEKCRKLIMAEKLIAKPYAVTVLTSTTDEEVQAQGLTTSVHDWVTELARRVAEFGVANFVCSVHERERLRKMISPPHLSLICPGLRVEDASPNDQKRTAGLADLADSEDTIFVVGRTLTESDHPEKIVKVIFEAVS